jgi:hypothetical protein
MGVKLDLTLMEEHRLRVFENRVLRRIFGTRREKVDGGWTGMYTEFRNLYDPPNVISVIK